MVTPETIGRPVRSSRADRHRRVRATALGRFVVGRLAWLIAILLVLIVVTFTLIHLAPGNPWNPVSATTPEGGRAAQLPPGVVARLNAKYGLDQPLWRQLLRYVANVAHFDFGVSYQGGTEKVHDIILRSWPPTFIIGAIAFVVIVPVGIGLGLWSAVRQDSVVDHLITGVAMLGASVPGFVVGILLVFPLSVGLFRATHGHFYLPAQGYGIDRHLVLPVVTLTIQPTSYLARLVRSNTLEVLRQEHVLTARAKGVRESLIIVRHVLKGSMIPTITALGPLFGFLITGSVIVESLFGIPGIGGVLIGAIEVRDYPVILGSVMFFAVILVVVNLVVDIAYAAVDPRVRLR